MEILPCNKRYWESFWLIDHYFLPVILEKYDFKTNFLRWIGTLLNNQESCIINVENITHYFKLKKGTRQGDLISAYFFILVLEAVFCVIKSNKMLKTWTFSTTSSFTQLMLIILLFFQKTRTQFLKSQIFSLSFHWLLDKNLKF